MLRDQFGVETVLHRHNLITLARSRLKNVCAYPGRRESATQQGMRRQRNETRCPHFLKPRLMPIATSTTSRFRVVQRQKAHRAMLNDPMLRDFQISRPGRV